MYMYKYLKIVLLDFTFYPVKVKQDAKYFRSISLFALKQIATYYPFGCGNDKLLTNVLTISIAAKLDVRFIPVGLRMMNSCLS